MSEKHSSLPHSWGLKNWPATVWPGSSSQARFVLRAYRSELLHAGALARVGRELIVLGLRYSRWLERKAADVPGYECPANRKTVEVTRDAKTVTKGHRTKSHIVERDRIIVECRDKGLSLKKTAEAVRHLDPTGIGWSTVLISNVEKRIRADSISSDCLRHENSES